MANNDIKVSIIIVTAGMHEYLRECIEKCLVFSQKNFEILVIPDDEIQLEYENIRVIPSGKTDPSTKKNLGAENARGEILAFVDSDAYPEKSWLKSGLNYFMDPKVAVVGGPNLTPEKDSLMQQANGIILGSIWASGPFAARYDIRRQGEGNELPSCNLFIRKSVLKKIGGFEVDLWPGEDAKFCFQVMDDLKMRVIYAPDVVVFHHRRELYLPYLKQIWGYGYTKGQIVTKFSNLRRLAYFIPSIFVIWLLTFPIALKFYTMMIVYLTILSIYLLGCIYTGLLTRKLLLGFVVTTGIFLTHVTYGIAFIAGIITRLQIK